MATRVVVLGGGVAGMSAAQELIERGFEVVVLEKREIPGGKARSIPVVDDGLGTSGHQRQDTGVASLEHKLPGEHGFRFFPGFYKHVIDTMRRILSFDGRKVADHLVPTTRVAITQYEKPTFVLPAVFPATLGDAGTVLRDILLAFDKTTGLTAEDIAYFGARIWQILTSCDARRLAEYEKINWWEFVGAEQRSVAYRKFLATGITRSLVAAKAQTASTRTIGDVFVQLILTIVNPVAGATDRVFDGPTNLVWIDPWLAHLESLGVEYRRNTRIEEIRCGGGKITGVIVEVEGRRELVTGDHYVSAIPLERIAPLVNDQMLQADPSLANLERLAPNVEWMNGIQFYLKRDVPTTHGHVIHIDSEWALTSISQLQFWRSVAPSDFGDSDVVGVLSVDLSDWTKPGSDGRTAMQCSREDVVRETWNQLKRSINIDQELLRDEDLHSWFLDPDIRADDDRPGYLRNTEPLLVNLVNTWALRPHARTAIPNFFLASDYVRTYTDLATMEGANEAARRAVNGLLDAVGYSGSRCGVWPLHEFTALDPFRLHDESRFKAGLPWDDTLLQVAAHALTGASPLLDQAGPLVHHVAPFISVVADVLDLSDGSMESANEVRTTDPTVKRGSAYVPTPQYPLIDLADDVPGTGDIVGPAGFIERLGWYRDMLTDTLISGVPTHEPQRHMYGLVSDFMERAGKGLRPALCIATARALGGNAENAFPAAAGIEMLHNAFLVHDDIEDASESRRGAATMHRRAGVPIAVNTGDAMNALAMRLFRKSGERLGPAVVLRILDEVDHMLIESLEGQATELGWIHDNNVGVGSDDYLRLVLKKTAWYSFIHPLRIGALVANGNDDNLGRFDRFGFLLGLAFQIKDDVLNLNGDESRYGKEIDGDLWEGKRTLILAHALAHAKPIDRTWIRDFL
ncbi:MAG: FAD-dependent oxidoreductase, partial [bacterium]